jgi:hemerythrin-like metal-binding protein
MENQLFVWTEEMSVGVALLDAQHRHLFMHVNGLLDRVDGRTSGDALSLHQLLDDIMNYNVYHIKEEEGYMHAFDCPDSDHLAAHAWYIARIKELFAEASGAVRSSSEQAHQACREFAMFTGHWHTRHIVEKDRTYKECFNEHGLR